MLRTLILLRHAKSDWGSGAKGDHERPLNARGERAAAVMGVYLRQEGLAPDLVLTSTAVRARTTAELVLRHGGLDAPVRAENDLYLADPERILATLRTAGEDPARILLVAHNPGLEELVQLVAARASGDLAAAAGAGLPTAGLAVCTCDTTWTEVHPGALTLTRIAAPKSLV